MTTNFFSPFSLAAVFGSEIQDPGWVKIRILDKHLGSATLGFKLLIRLPLIYSCKFLQRSAETDAAGNPREPGGGQVGDRAGRAGDRAGGVLPPQPSCRCLSLLQVGYNLWIKL
jgi:hypothetical protein